MTIAVSKAFKNFKITLKGDKYGFLATCYSSSVLCEAHQQYLHCICPKIVVFSILGSINTCPFALKH